MFNITIKQIIPNLLHLKFENQYEVTSTFLRLQEFYESPFDNIRNNYFTLEHYMDTYANEMGNFTYHIDWAGFNVPGNVVLEFYETFSHDMLLEKEKTLKQIIMQAQQDGKIQGDNFYIIGTYGGDDIHVIRHEIAHGLFYLNTEYRKQVLEILNKIPESNMEAMTTWLSDKGYTNQVFLDEINAYLSTSPDEELGDKFTEKHCPWEQVQQCRHLFEQYYEEQ